MKEMIKFYYNLTAANLEKKNDLYQFNDKDSYFFLYPVYRSTKELEEIYQICEELKRINIPVHTFILNKENKIITKIYEINYVLLKAEENPIKEYNILDIIKMENAIHLTKTKSELYRNIWGELWSKKIDYFEYQIRELGKDKKVILNSFTYYIGLAENAISYVNNTVRKMNTNVSQMITLCHKRVKFPNLSKEFLNPLFFIFDLRVRDIAEYIKSAFFNNEEEAWIEVKTFLSSSELTLYEYQMFFARLLYPSYYFDDYEEIMNKELDESVLLKYIKKAHNFEKFLNKIYMEIQKKVPIERVEWINNIN